MEHTHHARDERQPAARRVVALERHYRCQTCGHEHRSWSRLRSCADCGETLSHAVIRRAAVV
jgi:transcription elongation factor Elf1